VRELKSESDTHTHTHTHTRTHTHTHTHTPAHALTSGGGVVVPNGLNTRSGVFAPLLFFVEPRYVTCRPGELRAEMRPP
jgi:hypothetical protein